MKLYLLRHGESEGNKAGKFRGRMDYPLTENGKIQAEAAGQYLKDIDFEAVYSSPMKRAMQTAEAVCSAAGIDYSISEYFNNIELGEWEGKEKALIRKTYPLEWQKWINDPESLSVNGMESIEDIKNRVREGIELIRESHSGNVLIVSHRAVIKPLIAELLGIERPSFWRVHVFAAAVSVMEWREPTGWIMRHLNINHYIEHSIEEDA